MNRLGSTHPNGSDSKRNKKICGMWATREAETRQNVDGEIR